MMCFVDSEVRGFILVEPTTLQDHADDVPASGVLGVGGASEAGSAAMPPTEPLHGLRPRHSAAIAPCNCLAQLGSSQPHASPACACQHYPAASGERARSAHSHPSPTGKCGPCSPGAMRGSQRGLELGPCKALAGAACWSPQSQHCVAGAAGRPMPPAPAATRRRCCRRLLHHKPPTILPLHPLARRMELTFFRLRWLNVVVGLFQLLTGLAIFGISDYDGKTSLPWCVTVQLRPGACVQLGGIGAWLTRCMTASPVCPPIPSGAGTPSSSAAGERTTPRSARCSTCRSPRRWSTSPLEVGPGSSWRGLALPRVVPSHARRSLRRHARPAPCRPPQCRPTLASFFCPPCSLVRLVPGAFCAEPPSCGASRPQCDLQPRPVRQPQLLPLG